MSEAVNDLRVLPGRLVISSPLQKPALVPILNFQFRGEVAMPGAGSGVSYQSSHPELVGVSAGGLVYGLAETGSTPVGITVSYPGADPVLVPVSVDFSVTIDELLLEGVSDSQPLVLSRLNRYLDLPELSVRLSNGEVVAVPQNWRRRLEVLSANGLLQANSIAQLRANGVIDGSAPARVRLVLEETAGVNLEFDVLAQDAPPAVSIEAPGRVAVGEELNLLARASDDVRVARVDFLVDGAAISSRTEPPYAVTLPIGEPMLGKTLSVVALATDSAGNTSQSDPRQVTISAPPKAFSVSDIELKSPLSGQRVVEGAPVSVQVERYLGKDPFDFTFPVSRLTFHLDGKPVGHITGGVVEMREEGSPPEPHYYHVWRGSITIPSISTKETSLALTTTALGQGEGQEYLFDSRLIRIVANRPPVARFLSPVEGASVTAGSPLNVRLEYSDDTGAFGARVELLDGDDVLASQESTSRQVLDQDALNPAAEQLTFSIPTSTEDVGKRFRLRVRVTDYHGAIFVTDVITVPVVGDQPPTVSISAPVEGSSHVAGLPINIRASAVDDVGIERVDFFVDGRLVGSDYSAPYSIDYGTQPLSGPEQRLTLSAWAFDSAGQSVEAPGVSVVLGKDETAPVINAVSPVITETNGSLDLAPMLEEQVFVLKFAGFDNVAVERVELTGISRIPGGGWTITGQEADRASSEEIPMQVLPGAANAWSLATLVQAPAFSATPGVDQDIYRISATAYDRAGNASSVGFGIAVRGDKAPELIRSEADSPAYQLNDTLKVSVQARDDKAVQALHYQVYLGEALLHQQVRRASENHFVPMANVQDLISLPLSSLGLNNQNQDLRVQVVAEDERGQLSEPTEILVPVLGDDRSPVFGMLSPAPMARLTAGSSQVFSYRLEDDNMLATLRIIRSSGEVL
ncbi:MAG: Ig-like domain-containing protein, partial [Alcanivoracaceae bacterium]|nr:Ig-like domain-containing protein [Alcanivoracaceae bacterium]